MESRNLIISIKPEYAFKAVDGIKTIELRKKFPIDGIKNNLVIIYASSPVQQIIGYATIREVYKLPISSIWRKFNKQSCVTKEFFNSYFKGLDEGFAISLTDPVKLCKPIDIRILEKKCDFFPPQSYLYASKKMLKIIGI
ncbi:MAG: ASCH domain-containing protein [Pseudomonadota bacterium]